MANTVPLVRAAALVPFLRWMQVAHKDAEPLLRAEKLPLAMLENPGQLVPYVSCVRVALALMALEGPDIGCRVVNDLSIIDLAMLGRVALGSQTPRQAFERLMLFYPRHSSHESFAVADEKGVLVIRHTVHAPLDALSRHLVQQYVAALVRAALGGVSWNEPRLHEVTLTAHPQLGLDHIQSYFNGRVRATESTHMTIAIAQDLLDRPYLHPARDRMPPHQVWTVARSDNSLTDSIRAILPVLMDYGRPTVEDVAGLAGMSVRTLQRRLAIEGTSLSQLVDLVRRERALERIAEGDALISDIAAEVGYADQSSLSRAVRRWTAQSPRRLRVH